jgi:hypothetical protein
MRSKIRSFCACIVPIALIVILGIVGAFYALVINTAQAASCDIPSQVRSITEACIAYHADWRTIYAFIGAGCGTFVGVMLGSALFLFAGFDPDLPSDL